VHAESDVVEVLKRELRWSQELSILNGENLQDSFAMISNPTDHVVSGHRGGYGAGEAIPERGNLEAMLAEDPQCGVDLSR
jgi:hypothetical protein